MPFHRQSRNRAPAHVLRPQPWLSWDQTKSSRGLESSCPNLSAHGWPVSSEVSQWEPAWCRTTPHVFPSVLSGGQLSEDPAPTVPMWVWLCPPQPLPALLRTHLRKQSTPSSAEWGALCPAVPPLWASAFILRKWDSIFSKSCVQINEHRAEIPVLWTHQRGCWEGHEGWGVRAGPQGPTQPHRLPW